MREKWYGKLLAGNLPLRRGWLPPVILILVVGLARGEARLVFPQFANGEVGGALNRGRFFLVNRSAEAVTGRVIFRVRDGQGEVAKVPVDGKEVTEWPFAIPGKGSRLIETDGTGPLVVGAVEVVTDGPAASPLEAALTFELLGSFVSVQPAAPRMRGRVFASVSAEENTGVAVFNPGQQTAELKVELLDEAGNVLATKVLALGAGSHVARFVTEPELFEGAVPVEDGAFRGSLAWEVTSGPAVALVGLVQRASGALIALPAGEGFFQARDAKIWDFRGQEALLRGLNLGGWLVPEGYILKVPGYGSPSSIRALIVDLVGEEGAAQFYDAYYTNYVREVDIEAIRAWGFNSVRVPFHFNQLYDPETGRFLDEGFQRLDRVIRWCRERGLGVILDMHCAPGGQNPNNISDSDGVARLWLEEEYREQTVRVWREIARRYAWEKWVIGYDLLNEPVLPSGITNAALQALYRSLAEAVREVDPNHLLFVEGNWYATDFSRLEPPVDDQLVYSFHKYWNDTTLATIQGYLDLRRRTGKPLWVGEFGENSNPWGYRVIELFEANDIGWCWWNHKKVDTITSPLSAPLPENYRRVVSYWEGNGPRPAPAEALAGLLDLAEALRLENCRLLPDVVAALTDADRGSRPRPYAVHLVPGPIAAVDYDIGEEGYAYHDLDSLRLTYENWTPWNQGWQYRNDGVDIEASADPQGAGWNIGWTADGEWLRYTVEVAEAGRYDLRLRVAGNGGRLQLRWDGTPLGGIRYVPRTGGWQAWSTMTVPGLKLAEGIHVLRLDIVQGGFNLGTLEFVPAD
ncbi:MAG: hypothetical protein Kow00109_26590 [Acidobacteriota bacterium]